MISRLPGNLSGAGRTNVGTDNTGAAGSPTWLENFFNPGIAGGWALRPIPNSREIGEQLAAA